MCIRVKEKLRSSEMVVAGDQWPIFLYNRYCYDPKDPWNGLFRSVLLVSVSIFTFSWNFCLGWQICSRHINTSSHPRVPLKRNQRPPDLEMHASMGWQKSREPLLHTLLLRQVQTILFLFLHISDEYGWNQVQFALSSSPVFPGQTPSPTLRGFITPSLTFSKMLKKMRRSMICSYGGIGMHLLQTRYNLLTA